MPHKRSTRRRIRALAASAAPVLLLSGLAAAPAASAEPPAPPLMATPDGVPADVGVTLLTGDVVHVHALGDGTSTITVDRPDGADGGVLTSTFNGSTYVIPDEAMPYLTAKTVDADLFNVTRLIEYGYTDGIPVIASYGDAMPRTLGALDGATGRRTLSSIGAAAYTVDGEAPGALWDDLTEGAADARSLRGGIEHLWLDGKVRVDLTESVPQIGAPEAWAAGYDGEGTTVAVLDTGVDATHPDLVDAVTQTRDFTGSSSGVHDLHGHGTHVASTIAGSGAGDGKHVGVAPGADLIIGKVLGDDGFGQDSWIIDAMEWAVAEDADVVNMSLGAQVPDDGTDPMALAVNELSASSDTLFVIASGNNGCSGCISAPGSAASALTVGAVDKADALTWFTNTGPLSGSFALKPDIAAPGQDIWAARSSYAPGEGLYQSMSGTSMATPHVVGAAAILKQEHPDWTGERIKDALMSTSKQLDYTAYQIGTGRVDVAAAVSASVTATGAVDFGFHDWPHEGDGPATRTVVYTNDGDADVTLDLALNAADQAGAAAPAGAFTLSASTLTVPAGGGAVVDVTADPGLLPAGSTWAGKILASSAGTPATATGFGLVKEDERYGLTIKALDREGALAAGRVVVQTASGDVFPVDMDGETTLRLPPDTYSLSMHLRVPGTDGAPEGGLAVLLAPETTLTADTTVVLDARNATRVSLDLPRDTVHRQRHVWTHRTLSAGSVYDSGYMLPVTVDAVYVTPTEPVTIGDFEYYTRWREGASPLTLSLFGFGKIDATVQAGSVREEFRWWLKPTVYAGAGSAADYEGLDAEGRVAVVTRDDAVPPAERAAAAKAAGAELLVVINDRPGILSEYYPSAGMTVATVTAEQGRTLRALATWGVPLSVVSTPYTPFTYDVVDAHPNAVPEDLSYRPKRRDFARVDAVYYGEEAAEGGGFRYDLRPWSPRAIGFPERMLIPSQRTEWIVAPAGTEWHEVTTTADGWQSRGDRYVYEPGSRQTSEWFAPVVRPRLGLGFWQPMRYPGTWTTINVPAWGDSGPGRAGYMDAATSDMRLYLDGELVEQTEWQAMYLDLPVERHDYRLTLDAAQDAYELSTSTHTAWEFSSAAPAGNEREYLPLLQLDYDVDTDLGGDVKAGHAVTVGLAASHMPGVVGAGTVAGATFEVSYDDGATWRTVTLAADGGGRWTARLDDVPADASAYVSLRVSAWDDAGNTVEQEVIRAFGLR